MVTIASFELTPEQMESISPALAAAEIAAAHGVKPTIRATISTVGIAEVDVTFETGADANEFSGVPEPPAKPAKRLLFLSVRSGQTRKGVAA